MRLWRDVYKRQLIIRLAVSSHKVVVDRILCQTVRKKDLQIVIVVHAGERETEHDSVCKCLRIVGYISNVHLSQLISLCIVCLLYTSPRDVSSPG